MRVRDELWAVLVTHSWDVLGKFFGVYLITTHIETFTVFLLSLLCCYLPAPELPFKWHDVLACSCARLDNIPFCLTGYWHFLTGQLQKSTHFPMLCIPRELSEHLRTPQPDTTPFFFLFYKITR